MSDAELSRCGICSGHGCLIQVPSYDEIVCPICHGSGLAVLRQYDEDVPFVNVINKDKNEKA